MIYRLQYPRSRRVPNAFTLIELLVVMSIISLLMGILLSVLNTAKAQGRQIVCKSNVRQLVLANTAYADNNNGYYVPAALDILAEDPLYANKHRWYGIRNDTDLPFDTSRGPLASYLSTEDIKCTGKVRFRKLDPSDAEYDEGSGGYGYNMIYIGSRIWATGYEEKSCKVTIKVSEIREPKRTLMFADTAMVKDDYRIEYSLAEPRYFVVNGKAVTDSGWNPSPSIHFRHRGQANIGWADSHVSSKKMGRFDGMINGTTPAKMNIGWFEPMDNSLFDLK